MLPPNRMLTTKKRPCFQPVLLLGLVVVTLWTGCTPPGPSALLKGERLLKQERYSDAIVPLEQAVLIMPQEARAWNHLGLAYHYGNQRAKAVLAYQKALNLDRNLVATKYNLGCAQFELGNYQPAIDSLNAFLALQPQANEAPDSQLKIGTCQYELAIQAAGADRNRQLDLARRTIDQVISQSPSADAHNVAGLIHVQRNRMREAMTSFRAALQHQPGHAPALLNLAIVSQQYLNDRRAALQHYRDYLAVQPHPPSFAAVEEIARQLDLELTPQPIKPLPTNAVVQSAAPAATNVIAVRTNQPAPTNHAVVVNAATNRPRNEAISVQVATPARPNVAIAPETAFVPPTTQSTPATAPERPRPLEFTRVPDDPRLLAANDFAPNVPSRPSSTANDNSTPFIPGESQETTTNRIGVLNTLNPANWFTRKPKSGPKVTELPEPGGAGNQVSASRTTPAPVEFVPPRYQFMAPAKPIPGDREAAKVIFTRAANSHARSSYPEAIKGYKEAIRLDPAYYEAWYNLGLVAYEANDLPSALLAGEQAMAIKPEASAARYNFALALQRANYPVDAAAQLEEVLVATPNEARAHLTLANLYARDLGQPARARPHYQKVLALDPRHPQATQIRYWLVANP